MEGLGPGAGLAAPILSFLANIMHSEHRHYLWRSSKCDPYPRQTDRRCFGPTLFAPA